MGSASDWPTMQAAAKTLRDLEIPYEANVISAHRAPRRLEHYCGSAEERGIRALICAAGGAAHLAGVAAALTPIPVLACPMKAWSLEGLDSLLSMAQMPKGFPWRPSPSARPVPPMPLFSPWRCWRAPMRRSMPGTELSVKPSLTRLSFASDRRLGPFSPEIWGANPLHVATVVVSAVLVWRDPAKSASRICRILIV